MKFLLILTGIMWGISNTFLESFEYIPIKNIESSSFLRKIFTFLLKNLNFLLFLIIGQVGTLCFFLLLNNQDISYSTVVIITNSISILIGFIIEAYRKSYYKSFRIIIYISLSMLLMFMGVFILMNE